MDPHIKSQLTFVLFCICSFVMLIIYIGKHQTNVMFYISSKHILAVDEQLESSRAIAVSNTHALDLSGDRLSIDRKNIPPKCLPVNHIAFLPMLESNSPFIKSLFIHYGLKHHLRFVQLSFPFFCVIRSMCFIPLKCHSANNSFARIMFGRCSVIIFKHTFYK